MTVLSQRDGRRVRDDLRTAADSKSCGDNHRSRISSERGVSHALRELTGSGGYCSGTAHGGVAAGRIDGDGNRAFGYFPARRRFNLAHFRLKALSADNRLKVAKTDTVQEDGTANTVGAGR
jgi:hypothetical protein